MCPSLNGWRRCWRKGPARRLANCFFHGSEWRRRVPESRGFVGLRSAPASSTPRPRDRSHSQNTFLLLNSRRPPFVPAPTGLFPVCPGYLWNRGVSLTVWAPNCGPRQGLFKINGAASLTVPTDSVIPPAARRKRNSEAKFSIAACPVRSHDWGK